MSTEQEKSAARQSAWHAVQDGRLVRPANCERCGTSSSFIDAHHSDYRFALLVEWLCRSCHRREHLALARADMEQRGVINDTAAAEIIGAKHGGIIYGMIQDGIIPKRALIFSNRDRMWPTVEILREPFTRWAADHTPDEITDLMNKERAKRQLVPIGINHWMAKARRPAVAEAAP